MESDTGLFFSTPVSSFQDIRAICADELADQNEVTLGS